MKVVLDTNVLLVAISPRSQFHWVLSELIDGSYTVCFTNDILEEYAEIISRHMGHFVAEEVISGLLQLPNHEKVEKYYFWNLIKQDPDDDKFVDCAIAINADYIVSEDKHFQDLRSIEFPRVSVIGLNEFKSALLKLENP